MNTSPVTFALVHKGRISVDRVMASGVRTKHDFEFKSRLLDLSNRPIVRRVMAAEVAEIM